MKDKVKYFKCHRCGNIIEVLSGDVKRLTCCGEVMQLLVANTEEASLEKHIPVYEIDKDEIIVKVGEIIHPMEANHYIMWISLVTDERVIRIDLKPGDVPIVRFPYVKDAIIYEYCNIHGLWMNKVE